MFTRLPSNKTASLSYGVTIECSADTRSGEKATITWYKDGKPMASSPRYYKDVVTNYLHIFSVLVDDDGLYTCEASNDAGKIHASMYLTVRQKQIGKYTSGIYLTIRLRARDFYEVIVDEDEDLVNYLLIEIESE